MNVEISPQTAPLLSVNGLNAGYGGMPVLRAVSLDISRGEIVALVGSNGAGKTTLLRALSRVISYTGTVVFNGRDIGEMTPDQAFGAGLVQVPEGRQLFDRMTVEDNLLMGAYLRTQAAEVIRDLSHMYSLFPVLGERKKQLAGSMSGGEQQMCAIARALMARPLLLLIDEMSLGLAPVIVQQLTDVLTEIRREGMTLFLVEQDVQTALSIADRGYVMETGSIVHSGPAKLLESDPAVRQAYLGI